MESTTETVTAKSNALHFGHVGIIFACAVFLISISFMKSGFQSPLAKKTPVKKITYADAKAIALAQAGLSPERDGLETAKTQVAVLDPDFGAPQVAGASINALQDLGIPSAEESWSAEELSKIPVKEISDNSLAAFEKYKETMQNLETYYDLAFITFALNSDDKAMQSQAVKKADDIVKASVQVEVPNALVQFHKFRNIQYMEMGLMAKNMSGQSSELDIKDLSSEMFSVMEKINRLKTEIFEKYNFEV